MHHKKHEVILVLCVFLVVFCCSIIPLIIYGISSDVDSERDIEIEIDINNCPQQVSNQ